MLLLVYVVIFWISIGLNCTCKFLILSCWYVPLNNLWLCFTCNQHMCELLDLWIKIPNIKSNTNYWQLKKKTISNPEISANFSSSVLSRVLLPLFPTSMEPNQKSMLSMGSQYLINQSLHTQSGSQDARLSVHSTDWHTSHSLITCGDAFPLPQPVKRQERGLKHTPSIWGSSLVCLAFASLQKRCFQFVTCTLPLRGGKIKSKIDSWLDFFLLTC